MSLFSLRLLMSVVFSCFFAVAVNGQDVTPTAVTDQNRTGDLPYSTVIGTDIEHVVVTSGDLNVNIPIAHVKGRSGLDFDFSLRYNGRILAVSTPPGGGSATWTYEYHNYVPAGGIWQTSQPTLSYTLLVDPHALSAPILSATIRITSTKIHRE